MLQRSLGSRGILMDLTLQRWKWVYIVIYCFGWLLPRKEWLGYIHETLFSGFLHLGMPDSCHCWLTIVGGLSWSHNALSGQAGPEAEGEAWEGKTKESWESQSGLDLRVTERRDRRRNCSRIAFLRVLVLLHLRRGNPHHSRRILATRGNFGLCMFHTYLDHPRLIQSYSLNISTSSTFTLNAYLQIWALDYHTLFRASVLDTGFVPRRFGLVSVRGTAQ